MGPTPSSVASSTHWDSEAGDEESIVFPGRSSRWSSDDDAKVEKSHVPGCEEDNPSIGEAVRDVEQAKRLRLEEEEIMGRMDQELRAMIKEDRRKGIGDV